MNNYFIYILIGLYSLGGIISLCGFLPTIKDLYHKKPSANILTYGIWNLSAIATSLYGFFVIKDLAFNIVVNMQLIAGLTVLILALKLKVSK